MVLARAREIALINGRGPNHYTQDDIVEAKRELLGGTPSNDGIAPEDVPGLVTWDEAPVASGQPAARGELEDEQAWSIQLVEEGVEEAEHEQMVEGARNAHNQE